MNLYPRRILRDSLALALVCIAVVAALAQRRKPHQLRATALLELTTDAMGIQTARLTPITILDAGTFHDASIYKDTPRPMAVDIGVVYEAQKSGEPFGYVTISTAGKAGGIWTALGKWQLASAMAKATPTPPPAAPKDERPILHRGGSSAPPSSVASSPTPSPSPTPGSSPSPTPYRVEARPAEDPDRPILMRKGTAASEPVKPKAVSTPAQAEKKVPPKPGTQTMVAVSDTESIDSRSYEFIWKRGEQATMEAKLRRLALAQLPRENPPLTEHSLSKVVIRSFDLDLSNEAVMVLTAEVPSTTGAKGGEGAFDKAVTRYIGLVARIDLDGNPQRLLASVTDSSRLDVTPRLELVDAVDVDGDGYGELLFRQYSFDEKSFVIYGVGRSTVTKLFEGASSAIK